VLCLDVADLTEPELRREVLKLRRRVQKLTALLRLVLALRTSGFSLTGERLPDGRAKMRILRAVDRARAREFLPVASGPAVPAGVAESVPYLAPAAERVRTRRSVLLSPHVAGAAPGFARRALAEAVAARRPQTGLRSFWADAGIEQADDCGVDVPPRIPARPDRPVFSSAEQARARRWDYGAGKRAILSPRTDPTQISLPT